jgi:hypothetical protein
MNITRGNAGMLLGAWGRRRLRRRRPIAGGHGNPVRVPILCSLALVAVLAPPAAAQMRGGGGMPTTPVAAPLDKVPMGTWAEYTIQRGNDNARKQRYALVGKDAGAFVIESKGETGQGEKVLTRTVVAADPTAEGAVKKVVTQFGDSDPMEMPAGGMGRPGGPGGPGGPGAGGPGGPGAGGPGGPGGGDRGGPGGGGRMRGARFLKPDPKTLIGKESVKVPGGSFEAQHYKAEGPRGGIINYWLAKDAGPFGLVKLEWLRPAGEDDAKVIVELTAKGKGAKPELTKPAKPFDPEVMRARFQRTGGGPGGGQ